MCNIESLPLDCINHIKYYLCDFKKLELSCVKYYEYLYELQIMKLFYNTNWRFKNKIQKYDVSIVLDTLFVEISTTEAIFEHEELYLLCK